MGQMGDQHRLEMKISGRISALVRFIFKKKNLLCPSDYECDVRISN